MAMPSFDNYAVTVSQFSDWCGNLLFKMGISTPVYTLAWNNNGGTYVPSQRFLFDRSSIAKLKISHSANVVCDGSDSRIFYDFHLLTIATIASA